MPDLTGMDHWAAVSGQVMLAAAVGLSAVWMGVMAPRAIAVRRRLRGLQGDLALLRDEAGSGLARLAATRDQLRQSWRPWGLALRWATHPLTLALLRSGRRRWRSR
jgi:hypothetical protein